MEKKTKEQEKQEKQAKLEKEIADQFFEKEQKSKQAG